LYPRLAVRLGSGKPISSGRMVARPVSPHCYRVAQTPQSQPYMNLQSACRAAPFTQYNVQRIEALTKCIDVNAQGSSSRACVVAMIQVGKQGTPQFGLSGIASLVQRPQYRLQVPVDFTRIQPAEQERIHAQLTFAEYGTPTFQHIQKLQAVAGSLERRRDR